MSPKPISFSLSSSISQEQRHQMIKRKELIYMGWLVGWTEGDQAFLTWDAPDFYYDWLISLGYGVTRI